MTDTKTIAGLIFDGAEMVLEDNDKNVSATCAQPDDRTMLVHCDDATYKVVVSKVRK